MRRFRTLMELVSAILGNQPLMVYSTEGIKQQHLQLRCLLEDLLKDKAFEELRGGYHCPIESLHELSVGSDIGWEYGDRRKMAEFHSTLGELSMRNGAPLCPGPWDRYLLAAQGVITRYQDERKAMDAALSTELGNHVKTYHKQNGRETPGPMKPLSYDEKIGLLYEAHAAMVELLDRFFNGRFGGWEKEIPDIHLHLRLLIEDLVSDEELRRLKARYFCPFETLSGLEDPTPFLRARIGSDKWESSRRRLESFQGKLTELHIRAGSPGCPDVEAYKAVIEGLRQLSIQCRLYSDADVYDLSEEQLDKFLGQIRKAIAKIRAGFVGIEHRRMRLRPVEKETPRPGISTEEQEEVNKHGHKCSDRVHFPGISRKGRNVVVVNDQEVMMGDAPFILLLRLAVELLRDPEGWVHRQNLIDEGLMPRKPDDRLHKRASDLRQRLRGYLLQRNDKDFIENDGERRYRIRTAPSSITYDRNRLRKHGTPKVTDLAKRLPRSRRPKK